MPARRDAARIDSSSAISQVRPSGKNSSIATPEDHNRIATDPPLLNIHLEAARVPGVRRKRLRRSPHVQNDVFELEKGA
jgi:hypothetical protein